MAHSAVTASPDSLSRTQDSDTGHDIQQSGGSHGKQMEVIFSLYFSGHIFKREVNYEMQTCSLFLTKYHKISKYKNLTVVIFMRH